MKTSSILFLSFNTPVCITSKKYYKIYICNHISYISKPILANANRSKYYQSYDLKETMKRHVNTWL